MTLTFGCRGRRRTAEKDYWRNRTGVTAATARQFMLKSTGTRTRLATATPFSVAGLKRHFRAAWTAARSRSRLRLERSTSTASTLPWASMLMTRITVDAIPARSALGGERGGSCGREDGSTEPSVVVGAGGDGGAGGGAGTSTGLGSSTT